MAMVLPRRGVLHRDSAGDACFFIRNRIVGIVDDASRVFFERQVEEWRLSIRWFDRLLLGAEATAVPSARNVDVLSERAHVRLADGPSTPSMKLRLDPVRKMEAARQD